MQWEWRVFFAVSDPKTSSEAHDSPNKTGLPDIWRLLHARPSSSSAAEVRTDVYVACTPRSGVKFRAGRTLEVKLRFELHDSGAERWEKVCSLTARRINCVTPPPNKLVYGFCSALYFDFRSYTVIEEVMRQVLTL